jgi:queuine tRNA-ribosyltransferase
MSDIFEIADKDKTARTGILKTAHGKLLTPMFMPVATKGSVKFTDFRELKQMKTQAVISNSLLLYLRPGLETIRKAGGLHRFMNWDKGIFTDSGGFQVLDDYLLQKTTDEGAYFKSPYDGKKHILTPKLSAEIQAVLGSDVAMVLDDVAKYNAERHVVEDKLQRTIKWAKEFQKEHEQACSTAGRKKRQLVFGIAQGGTFNDLRKKSIQELNKLDFDGMALGGLAIGEPMSKMQNTIKFSTRLMPSHKPRYLMGVGSPADLVMAIGMGVDVFDSTMPTKNARHGTMFTMKGRLRIDKKEYGHDTRPIDEECDCFVCRNYTRAYIQHQLRMNEPTGKKIATYHNLHFMQSLIRKSREAIEEGKFDKFKAGILKVYLKD